MTYILIFNPLAAMFGATTALLLMALIFSNRRTRRIVIALAILSPGAPLFLIALVLTVTRMLVYWLTSKMPNAASMHRAALDLEAAMFNSHSEEDDGHSPAQPDQDARSKILRFPQR